MISRLRAPGRLHQLAQRVNEGRRVCPKSADGLPGFAQAFDREGAGTGQELDGAFVIRCAGGEHAVEGIELEHQCTETVGEDVVDLSRRVGPLGQRGSSGVLFPRSFGVDQAQFRLVRPQHVLLAARSGEEPDHHHGAQADVVGCLSRAQE